MKYVLVNVKQKQQGTCTGQVRGTGIAGRVFCKKYIPIYTNANSS